MSKIDPSQYDLPRELIDDYVASLIQSGGGNDIIYDDAANKLIVRSYSINNFLLDDHFLGTPMYIQTTSGSGASSSVVSPSIIFPGHPGLFSLTTGSTAAGSAGFRSSAFVYKPSLDLEYECDFYPLGNPTTAENFSYYFGFSDNTVLTNVIARGTLVNTLPTTGEFVFRTISSTGVETQYNTGQFLTASTWYNIKIKLPANENKAVFTLTGTPSTVTHTITDNMPPDGNGLTAIARMLKTAGTGGRSFYIDRLKMQIVGDLY